MREHWLLGPEFLKALITAGVVPAMTSAVEIVADPDNFVTVRATIALSTEQVRAVAALLPDEKETEADRLRAVIEATREREAAEVG